MYKPIATLLYLVLKVLLRKVKIIDKKNLPADSRYVVTCTHTSMVEIVILAIAVYPNEINYMAKQELFKNKFLKWFFTNTNAFPVNRDNPGPSTLKIPVKLLNQGKTIGMFPAGSRQAGAPVKRGAATIAVLGKAPIVPASYKGVSTFKELFKRGTKTFIKFGQPIHPQDYLADYKKSEAIDMITAELEMRMNQLSLDLENKN
ncbi:lysophospholipid acyltransferase family protein [Macrococcus equipercicus]|uniref:1-acyl-sn-glycerol-3-phosphate acyltransferase n=1 Tax=Macrococcus equipercicus TaxID=69967 RepID=A0A9Q9BKC0_9STAP|nr:lysophospholipid acyltransferase family protein [Macrococcus equipercicus]KAA1038425.1 1-acyl-sn-glycerol-3-phosphate acyltransferase [Macrococcus equipercicus]UTH13188.1 1-acyl-sn-glycerol-3-phosphate acyltransferase [Macrococcus equipercicus]